MKTLTREALISLVRARLTEADTQAQVASDLRISRQTLSQLLTGRYAPGPRVLKALGYRKVVMYEKAVKG